MISDAEKLEKLRRARYDSESPVYHGSWVFSGYCRTNTGRIAAKFYWDECRRTVGIDDDIGCYLLLHEE